MSAICTESEVDHYREALPLPQNFESAELEEGQILGERGSRVGGVQVRVAAFRKLELASKTGSRY